MTNTPRFLVSPTPEALADQLAHDLYALLAARTNASPQVHVVLTGGTVAALVHLRAASLLPHRGEEIRWTSLHLWWGDERWALEETGERNDAQAREQLIDALPLAPDQVHVFPSPVDAAAAESTASLLEAARHFAVDSALHLPDRFDLVMLGTGPDGHVASLFPDHEIRVVSADVVAVENSPKPPSRRLSLSMDRLVRTERLWIMATGEAKAPVIQQAAERSLLPLGSVTSGALAEGAGVTWYLDTTAASLLVE